VDKEYLCDSVCVNRGCRVQHMSIGCYWNEHGLSNLSLAALCMYTSWRAC